MKKLMKFGVIFGAIFCLSIISFNFVLAENKDDKVEVIKKLKPSPNAPELIDPLVSPNWGKVCQRYAYRVIYRDKRGLAPKYVKLYLRPGSKPKGKMYNMQKLDKNQNNYKQGVTYVYYYRPNKIEDHFYFTEASNGLGKVRAGIIDTPSNGPALFRASLKKNEIALLDIKKGEKIWSYNTGEEWVDGVALSDDGKYLAAKTSYHVYLFETGRSVPKWSYYRNMGTSIGDGGGGIAISADGSKIFVGFEANAILFSKDSANPIWEYSLSTPALGVDISADGNYAAIGTIGETSQANSNLIIFWRTSSLRPIWQYQSSGNFHDVSLSRNGDYVVGSTGCPDRRFYLFSRESNNPIIRSKMLTKDSPVHRAEISLDGSIAAAGTEAEDGSVFVFRKKSKKRLWKFSAPKGRSFRGLSLSWNGRFVGGTTMNGYAYIFRSSSNEPIASWKVNASLGATGITNNGNYLVAGGADKKVHIFKKNKVKGEALKMQGFVDGIAVSKNGKFAAAGTGGHEYFFEKILPKGKTVYKCK